MKAVLKPDVEIPFTPYMVKEYLWKPVQKYMLGKEHTAELTTAEVTKVYEVVNRLLGEKHGLHVDFPVDDTYLNNLLRD
jgi:hypothetical protein